MSDSSHKDAIESKEETTASDKEYANKKDDIGKHNTEKLTEAPHHGDVTLNVVTHPSKIGIMSTGGLSNQILTKMQEDFPNLFSGANFQMVYNTFELPEEPKNELELVENSTSGDSERGEIKQNKIKKQTNLYSFSKADNVQQSAKSDDNNEIVLENTKNLSLKERALHIFHELKKKFGLISEEDDTDDQRNINDSTNPQSLYEEQTNEQYEAGIRDNDTHHTEDKESELKLIDDELYKIRQYIFELIEDKDVIFIVSYLDDENDVQNTFQVVELAKQFGVFSIILTCLPRYFGKVDNVRLTNKTLQKLRLRAEMVILLPYFDRLDFKLIPDLIIEMMEIITEPGLINIDLADFKIVVKGGNIGVITFGTGRHDRKVAEALEKALTSKLLNVELGGVKKILINITGGSDMTLSEVEVIAEQLKNRIQPNASLILGARINNELNNILKVFIMLGVTPMQVMVNSYANE
jgi:hypothetical protein